MEAILHLKSPCIRFCKRGMFGLVCRRMFTIGAGLAKDASHLGREFCSRSCARPFWLMMSLRGTGKNYILTAADYLSRWAEARAVKQITAKDLAKFLYEDIWCNFGVPLELLSDQGPSF